ncbi:alpha/beta hydrolase family esterase [Vibrio ulleungensis]|uniref:Alpha/beta hydrolase fold domain-containing protein n=1 Tax=Vibrio ulleungensis TaxID=2807619 RepID=A0ABS2HFS8_9VIBR|nr:PHB depolymerase family esterase [Vibrio ulleungensis]MBM7034973.1 alpha/beta hydrolase fold domain-containing protein [Vibrio ulleungensis]
MKPTTALWLTVGVFSALLTGCNSSSSPKPESTPSASISTATCETELTQGRCVASTDGVNDRGYYEYIADSVTDESPALLISLHGFGNNIDFVTEFAHGKSLSEAQGYVYVAPQSFKQTDGGSAWNGPTACCWFDRFNPAGVPEPDDKAFLKNIIDQQVADNNVDPNRVFIMGHSNGGFMALRTACEMSEKVTAVVSIAGLMRPDVDQCQPENPVSVLQIHGEADQTVSYLGNTFNARLLAMASADAVVGRWAQINQCDATPTASSTIDLTESDVVGGIGDPRHPLLLTTRQAQVSQYQQCANDTSVQLATIEQGTHVPEFIESQFIDLVGRFLEDYGTRTISTVTDVADMAEPIVFDVQHYAITPLNRKALSLSSPSEAFGIAKMTRVNDDTVHFELNLYDIDPATITSIAINSDANGNADSELIELFAGTSYAFQGQSLFGLAALSQTAFDAANQPYLLIKTTNNTAGELSGNIVFDRALLPTQQMATLSGGSGETADVTLSWNGRGNMSYSLALEGVDSNNITSITINPVGSDEAVLNLYPIPSGFPDPDDFAGINAVKPELEALYGSVDWVGTILDDGGLQFVRNSATSAELSSTLEIKSGTQGVYEQMLAYPELFEVIVDTNAQSAQLTGTLTP